MLIADYLFQYGVFNIDINDEIEATKTRRKKIQLILHYLEGEFSSSIPTFVHVLEITERKWIVTRIYELYMETSSKGKILDMLFKSIVMSYLQTLCKI